MVLAEAHTGQGVREAHAAAVFFPRGEASAVYGRLTFARDTLWDGFIAAYTGQPVGRPRRG